MTPKMMAANTPIRTARCTGGNSFHPQYSSFSPAYTSMDTSSPTPTATKVTKSMMFHASMSPESVRGEKYAEFARYHTSTTSIMRKIELVKRNLML